MLQKSITPPPVEKQSTPPPPAQNLDENGLLDGIEEPMKLRKVSMDTGKELDAEDTAILNVAVAFSVLRISSQRENIGEGKGFGEGRMPTEENWSQ